MAGCTCSLSIRTGFGAMINEMLAEGQSPYAIEKKTREAGRAVKQETVSRHLRECLDGVRPGPGMVQVAIEQREKRAKAAPRDLALLVQQRAVEGLEDGTLKVSVKDGLTATALLDKRDARMEDQRFMIGLARLLSGAGSQGPIAVIDVTPENPLLAPPHLRADD